MLSKIRRAATTVNRILPSAIVLQRQYHPGNNHNHNHNHYHYTSSNQGCLYGSFSKDEILQLSSTPKNAPSYPRGPYRFYNREYIIIAYETDPEALRRNVPEPLEPASNIVLFEWINMLDSSGFGSYRECGSVIPVKFQGQEMNYVHSMYLNDEPPVAAGREIWGFPKKWATPTCEIVKDTICGRLHYANELVAQGTMVYKHKVFDAETAVKALCKPQVLLKIIPDVDFTPKIAQLVGFSVCDVDLKGAWEGPARLNLFPHANAQLADLPIKRIVNGKHIIADITLPYGNVIYDYIGEKKKAIQAHNQALAAGLQPPVSPYTKSYVITNNPIGKDSHNHDHHANQNHNKRITVEKIANGPICMPVFSPSYNVKRESKSLKTNREHYIIKYRSDPEKIKSLLPDKLEANPNNEVMLEWVKTSGVGLGAYDKLDVLIPCTFEGKECNFGAMSFVNSSASITLGREVLGMAQKYALPEMSCVKDTLKVSLTYSSVPVCTGTLRYKESNMDIEHAEEIIGVPQVNLKFIPDPQGKPAIAQLVRSDRTGIHVHKAWKSHGARLTIFDHVHAPLSDLPVLDIIEGYHVQSDMALRQGVVIHDYLEEQQQQQQAQAKPQQ